MAMMAVADVQNLDEESGSTVGSNRKTWLPETIQESGFLENEAPAEPMISTPHGSAGASPSPFLDRLSETELANRFATQLVVVVDRQLSRYLRHKVEPEDISQSVFRSFFRRHRLGEFEFRDWNGVWGLLVRLAVCKCRNRVAYLRAQRRDVRRELSLDWQLDTEDADFLGPVDEQPFPDDQAAVSEVVESFLQDLSADDQSILAGHLAGHHSPKISTMVGCSEQTVRRRLQQMERRLRNRLCLIEAIEMEVVAM